MHVTHCRDSMTTMDTPAWGKKMDDAVSAQEVLDLVREYLETRDPSDLALVHKECPLPSAYTHEEIAAAAYALSAHHAQDEAATEIKKLGVVLSRATVRLAELARY